MISPNCEILQMKNALDSNNDEARKKTAALGLDVSDTKHAFRLVPVLNSISAGKLIDYTDMQYPTGWADD